MVAFKYRKVTLHERKDGNERLHDAMYDALDRRVNRKLLILKLRGYYRQRATY
jgi:hypothetical protein